MTVWTHAWIPSIQKDTNEEFYTLIISQYFMWYIYVVSCFNSQHIPYFMPPPPPPTTWRLLYMCDWVHIHNSFCFCNIPCFFRLKFYSHNMSLNLCFISSTIRLLVLIFAMVMTMKDIFLYTAVYICISFTLFPI